MTQITSPLGKRTVQSNQRVLEVPDESEGFESQNPHYKPHQPPVQKNDFTQEMENLKRKEEYFDKRKKLVKGQERLSAGALDRISALIGMLQVTREVNIDGVVFVLRSLKNHEFRDIMNLSSQTTTLQYPFELQNQHLARSLVSVGGLTMDTFLGSDDLEDKLLFVENLDSSVAQRLYKEFVILKEEVNEKYSIKTEGEAKEIVENLKK